MERQIEELRQTLAQVHQDSQEIERELEAEIVARDKTCEGLQTKLAAAIEDSQRWKQQVDALKAEAKTLEAQNEDYEQEARIRETSMARLEQENERLLELLALAETDSCRNEAESEELQRTRDKLVETEDELRKLHRQIELLTSKQQHRPSKHGEFVKGAGSELSYDIIQPTELRSNDWTRESTAHGRLGVGGALAPTTSRNTLGHGTTGLNRLNR